MLKKITLTLIGLVALTTAAFFYMKSPHTNQGQRRVLKTYSSDAALPADTLKVMTFNIGYLSGMLNNLAVPMPKEVFEENMRKSLDMLRQVSPHVIGFQEIDFGASRSFKVHQLDELATTLGYHQAYQSVNWDKRYVPFPYWPPKYHFGKMNSGQAILSKYPLSAVKTEVLIKPVNAPFYYNALYLDRLVQFSTVTIGERKALVMNLHLEAFDQETRLQQAQAVREFYEVYASEMPVLLIGDFNATPPWTGDGQRDAMRTIMTAPNIASAIDPNMYRKNEKGSYTFSSGEPYQMIDYILYNPSHIRKVSARVVGEAGEISDHLPVLMEFVFVDKIDGTIGQE
jgi:endonuclease/exonuclease/phosphatase family metal-dependent hydrolase